MLHKVDRSAGSSIHRAQHHAASLLTTRQVGTHYNILELVPHLRFDRTERRLRECPLRRHNLGVGYLNIKTDLV
jgi:hypothetical protein